MDVNHGAPVEDVASIISGYAICAVGGEKLAMYDVTGGGKVLRDAVNHQVQKSQDSGTPSAYRHLLAESNHVYHSGQLQLLRRHWRSRSFHEGV